MKHMLFDRPDFKKQLAKFKGKPNLIEELKQHLSEDFQGFSVVRIESSSGNGSSFLLHALANELSRKELRVAFLHFKSDTFFSDLTEYHLSEILQRSIVCIDNLHVLLQNQEQKALVEEFLKELAAKNGKLIYACQPEENLENQHWIAQLFTQPAITFSLLPLSSEERQKWARRWLFPHAIFEIPLEVFEEANSNRDFLTSLKPYIEQQEWQYGTNYAEIQKQKETLSALELRLLSTKIGVLELEAEKQINIREQYYERAAATREKQVRLLAELLTIRTEIENLSILPKPSEQAMELYVYHSALLKTIKAEETAQSEALVYLEKRVESANINKAACTDATEQVDKLKAHQDTINWTQTLERFRSMEKKTVR